MDADEPMDDELRARRARVFRKVREEQRHHNAAVRREYDDARDRAKNLTKSSQLVLPGVIWAIGVTAATKLAPVLSDLTGAPTTVVFATLGFLLGSAHGASLNATSARSRLRHTLAVAAFYAAFLGAFTLIWPPRSW